ncbi:MAG TPA: hypothetical protein VFG81_08235 [Anaerolineales bacterium]|nr:hypothetical protein [Anaerolineales bacterium]
MDIATPPVQQRSPQPQKRAARAKAREYTGPLGILAAGAIGLSLLCSVSAMAMGDLSRYVPITLEPINIIDLAVANFQTAAALTEQIVTVFVPTETLVPTSTDAPPSITPSSTDTPRRFVTITPTLPRRTRIPSTRTPTPRPPTATRTSVPPTATRTRTPVPPTSTRTNTPITPADPPTNPPSPTVTEANPPTEALSPTAVDTSTQAPSATAVDTLPPTSVNPVLVPSATPATPGP